MIPLSLTSPIASLLEAAGVTRSALADALGVRRESVRDGESIKLSTLARAAESLGFRLKLTIERIETTKKGATK